ncbi:hypothetical protein WAI453_000638 [Rhynchosporium graminicola]
MAAHPKAESNEKMTRLAQFDGSIDGWVLMTRELVVWLNEKPGAVAIRCGFRVALYLRECSIRTVVVPAEVFIDALYEIESLQVCYCFCDNQDNGRDNPSERILGVIVTQLLRAHPELAPLITNELIIPGMSSGLAQLRTLVPKLLELQPRTWIVFDRIDECSKFCQKSLITELQRVCFGVTTWQLDRKPEICLDENGMIELDIRRYGDHKVQHIRSLFEGDLEPATFAQIASSVADKADGMFLWVSLVTEEVEQCFCARDLEMCARSLPHGLKEAL